MRCDEALSIIDMYLDECTDAYDEKEFLEHIETCESCRNAYNEIKRITNELNNIDYLPLPDNFHNELTEKLVKSGKSKKRNTLVKYSAVAACAVVIFITGAYMKDLYYMASNGNSAASADTASVTESSQMSRSASEAMPQESPEFSSDSSSASIYDSAEGGVTNEAAQSDLSGAKLSADEENLARKIVKNGYISLDVENFDDTAKLIKNYT